MGFQLFAQFDVIVNFTVENDDIPLIAGDHRLIASHEINDCQPSMPERDVGGTVASGSIRSAMHEAVRHRFVDDGNASIIGVRAQDTAYATHKFPASFVIAIANSRVIINNLLKEKNSHDHRMALLIDWDTILGQ